MSALSVVILLLGSLLEILDLTAVMITALIVVIAREELGLKSVAVFVVTAVISLFIIPNKLLGIEYAVISIYPILAHYFNKLAKPIQLPVKGAYFVIASVVIVLLTNYVFMPGSPLYMDIVLSIGGVVLFVLFDILLFKFIMLYRFKLRHQLRLDRFFIEK